jgi:hypothetical protein
VIAAAQDNHGMNSEGSTYMQRNQTVLVYIAYFPRIFPMLKIFGVSGLDECGVHLDGVMVNLQPKPHAHGQFPKYSLSMTGWSTYLPLLLHYWHPRIRQRRSSQGLKALGAASFWRGAQKKKIN